MKKHKPMCMIFHIFVSVQLVEGNPGKLCKEHGCTVVVSHV